MKNNRIMYVFSKIGAVLCAISCIIIFILGIIEIINNGTIVLFLYLNPCIIGTIFSFIGANAIREVIDLSDYTLKLNNRIAKLETAINITSTSQPTSINQTVRTINTDNNISGVTDDKNVRVIQEKDFKLNNSSFMYNYCSYNISFATNLICSDNIVTFTLFSNNYKIVAENSEKARVIANSIQIAINVD